MMKMGFKKKFPMIFLSFFSSIIEEDSFVQ